MAPRKRAVKFASAPPTPSPTSPRARRRALLSVGSPRRRGRSATALSPSPPAAAAMAAARALRSRSKKAAEEGEQVQLLALPTPKRKKSAPKKASKSTKAAASAVPAPSAAVLAPPPPTAAPLPTTPLELAGEEEEEETVGVSPALSSPVVISQQTAIPSALATANIEESEPQHEAAILPSGGSPAANDNGERETLSNTPSSSQAPPPPPSQLPLPSSPPSPAPSSSPPIIPFPPRHLSSRMRRFYRAAAEMQRPVAIPTTSFVGFEKLDLMTLEERVAHYKLLPVVELIDIVEQLREQLTASTTGTKRPRVVDEEEEAEEREPKRVREELTSSSPALPSLPVVSASAPTTPPADRFLTTPGRPGSAIRGLMGRLGRFASAVVRSPLGFTSAITSTTPSPNAAPTAPTADGAFVPMMSGGLDSAPLPSDHEESATSPKDTDIVQPSTPMPVATTTTTTSKSAKAQSPTKSGYTPFFPRSVGERNRSINSFQRIQENTRAREAAKPKPTNNDEALNTEATMSRAEHKRILRATKAKKAEADFQAKLDQDVDHFNRVFSKEKMIEWKQKQDEKMKIQNDMDDAIRGTKRKANLLDDLEEIPSRLPTDPEGTFRLIPEYFDTDDGAEEPDINNITTPTRTVFKDDGASSTSPAHPAPATDTTTSEPMTKRQRLEGWFVCPSEFSDNDSEYSEDDEEQPEDGKKPSKDTPPALRKARKDAAKYTPKHPSNLRNVERILTSPSVGSSPAVAGRAGTAAGTINPMTPIPQNVFRQAQIESPADVTMLTASPYNSPDANNNTTPTTASSKSGTPAPASVSTGVTGAPTPSVANASKGFTPSTKSSGAPAPPSASAGVIGAPTPSTVKASASASPSTTSTSKGAPASTSTSEMTPLTTSKRMNVAKTADVTPSTSTSTTTGTDNDMTKTGGYTIDENGEEQIVWPAVIVPPGRTPPPLTAEEEADAIQKFKEGFENWMRTGVDTMA